MARRKVLELASTSVSPMAQVDRRGEQRFVTIYRPGKLVCRGVEELCLVRNVSTTGAMVQHKGAVEVEDAITLFLRLEEPITGRVAWVRDGFVGLEFHEPIDLASRIGPGEPGDPRPRPPRLKIPVQVRVHVGNTVLQAVTSDISQSGAKLHVPMRCAPGTEMRVSIDGLGTFLSTVRWARDDMVGVAFVRSIAIWELADWIRNQHLQSDRLRAVAGHRITPEHG